MIINKWTAEDINTLKKIYPNTQNNEIAKILNKTRSSVSNKANDLKLLKTKAFRSFLIGKRNKMVGRDLTFDLLKEIASKYRTRSEFQLKDSSAYSVARTHGYINEICSHMAVVSFSIPQLILNDILETLFNRPSIYNSRRVISPYEIDVYFPDFRLAFEYNGKRWHEEDRTDTIKREILTQNNISYLYLKENNRRYEEDIKDQLIQNIDFINKISQCNLTEDQIRNCVVNNIYLKIYNKQDLFDIAKKYTSFSDFIKKEPKIYYKLWKSKLLHEATTHMKDKKTPYTAEILKSKIDKFIYLKDLIKNDFPTYQCIKRHKKFEYLLNSLIRTHPPYKKKQ